MRWSRAGQILVVGIVALVGAASSDSRRGYTRESGSAVHVFLVTSWFKTRALEIPRLDRYGDFTETYNHALELYPDPYTIDDFASFGRDRLLSQQDDIRAIMEFHRMLEITPDNDTGWSDLAWLYAVGGDTTSAITAEENAISLYSNDYTYYVLLGVFYEKAGMTAKAEAAYSQALILFPRFARSSAWHSLQRRQAALAAAAVQSALQTLSLRETDALDPMEAEGRARLLLESGHISEAQGIVNVLSDQIENLSSVWELQGELHDTVNRSTDAMLDYRRAAFLDRSDPLPHERLAELAMKSRDMDVAVSEARQALWLFMRLKSPSAARSTVEFQQTGGPRDGLLPSTLLKETQPKFNFASLFFRLAKIYRQRGAMDQANELERMAEDIAATTDGAYDAREP